RERRAAAHLSRRPVEGGAPRTRRRRARARGHGASGQALPRAAVRRPATARRGRARPGRCAVDPACRRADRKSRFQERRGGHGPARRAARHRFDHLHGHPRPALCQFRRPQDLHVRRARGRRGNHAPPAPRRRRTPDASARAGRIMSGLVSALRLAVRSLLARPTFFLAAVATLALGICALAAIYSVYDAVLLRPLPFAHAERIVEVTRAQTPIRRGPVARQVFEEWRDGSEKAFEAFGAYSATTMNLTGAGDAARLTGYAVTPGFWEVFGHPLALGRAFGAEEERSNERVVVLSNAVWRNRFDASETIIGRQVLLNGESYRVTGVGAAGLAYPMDGEVWLPTYLPASTMERGSNYLNIVARLRPGVGPEEANLAMAPLTAWQAKNWPDNHMGMAANVEPLQAA